MAELSFTCPRCLTASHDPNDVREGYCGRCHSFTGVMPRDYDRITTVMRIAAQRVDPR